MVGSCAESFEQNDHGIEKPVPRSGESLLINSLMLIEVVHGTTLQNRILNELE